MHGRYFLRVHVFVLILEQCGRHAIIPNSYLALVYGSFHVISTQKIPDPLRFLRKLVTIKYLVSDDATPILGSPHPVFLDLWPFLCGHFFANFADLKCLSTHNSIILKS